jgi:hypothetical protein
MGDKLNFNKALITRPDVPISKILQFLGILIKIKSDRNLNRYAQPIWSSIFFLKIEKLVK